MQPAAAFLLALVPSVATGMVLRGQSGAVAINEGYASQCHKKVNRRVLRAGRVHAAEEYVVKDGFWHVGCEKDSMYEGSPHGLNISIVHYEEQTLKEDRQAVTPARCFEFCRSKPGATYFGLRNGRECYCTPYFTNDASDDSECDAVCEGDKTQMCGSMTKSTIFQMHVCGSEVVVARLKSTASDAKAAASALKAVVGSALTVASSMQTDGDKYQKMFGTAGDPAASNLMQTAKQAAGVLQHAAEGAAKAADSAKDDLATADALSASDDVKKVFALNEDLETFTAMVAAESKAFNVTFEKYAPSHSQASLASGPSSQYYPVLYFAEQKKHQDKPSTCTGSSVGQPQHVKSTDECAASCDKEIHSCVGYQLVGDLCFLFSDFKEAMFYTKCPAEPATRAACMAKVSKFQGTTLKPDGAGKCKQCLKKLTQRDNCYLN